MGSFHTAASCIFRAHPPDGQRSFESGMFQVGRSDVLCAACLRCVIRMELNAEVCVTPQDPTVQITVFWVFSAVFGQRVFILASCPTVLWGLLPHEQFHRCQ